MLQPRLRREEPVTTERLGGVDMTRDPDPGSIHLATDPFGADRQRLQRLVRQQDRVQHLQRIHRRRRPPHQLLDELDREHLTHIAADPHRLRIELIHPRHQYRSRRWELVHIVRRECDCTHELSMTKGCHSLGRRPDPNPGAPIHEPYRILVQLTITPATVRVMVTETHHGTSMRAVIHERYGPPDVLRLTHVPVPTPAADQVLIKVHAATVNRTDTGFRQGKPWFVRFFSGLRRPKQQILGSEVAGTIEAIGSAVTEFAVGDRVFGVHPDKFGAHAEFMCMAETAPLTSMPTDTSFEEAASVSDGFILAVSGLRSAGIGPGQRIVVYGASGSIGTAAVQLAKHFGAHVTAVCNTANVDLVRSLGADVVLDYTADDGAGDFATNGEQYDFIFDAVGKYAYRKCKRSLVVGGVYISTDLGDRCENPVLPIWTRFVGPSTVKFPIPKYRKADVIFLRELMEAGEYRAVIDRRYPLEEIVEATRYVDSAQKTGNVVITVSE